MRADTIAPLLFKAFGISAKARKTAFRKLGLALREIFHGIRERNFDEVGHDWITSEFVEHYFRKQHFGAFFKTIDEHSAIQFTGHKPKNLRNTLAAICAVASAILSKNSTTPLSREQNDIFEALERKLRDEEQRNADRKKQTTRAYTSIPSERPKEAIYFSHDKRILIDINNQVFFPFDKDNDESAVLGRFYVYRHIFSKPDGDEFIVEYLAIERDENGPGLKFKMWTRIKVSEGHLDTINGVCFFTDGGFWLLGSHTFPFKRLRVMAANILEWHRHQMGTQSICTGVFLGHKANEHEKIPQARIAIFKRDRVSRVRRPGEKVQFLTRKGLEEYLSPDDIKLLDEEAHIKLLRTRVQGEGGGTVRRK